MVLNVMMQEILSITHDNLQRNLPEAVAESEVGEPRVVIKPLLWGAGQEATLNGPFDYIFASDLLYNTEQ